MQNTDNKRLDWLKWRTFGVGGSDVPAIMGDSPYSNILDIYDSKINPVQEKEPNYAMALGNKLEPIARSTYELLTGNDFPAANFVHASKPYLRVSLDGYNLELNKAIEVKYCGRTFTDSVPLKYKAQVQYQFMVTNCKELDMVQINNMNNINVIKIERDDEYILKLIEKVDWFWACVQKRDRASIEAYYETIKPVKKARKKKVKAEAVTEECLQ